jgi:hypothetical protein
MVAFDLLIPQAIRFSVNNDILGGDIDSVVKGSLYMAVFAIASMLFATANAWYAPDLSLRSDWSVAGRGTNTIVQPVAWKSARSSM